MSSTSQEIKSQQDQHHLNRAINTALRDTSYTIKFTSNTAANNTINFIPSPIDPSISLFNKPLSWSSFALNRITSHYIVNNKYLLTTYMKDAVLNSWQPAAKTGAVRTCLSIPDSDIYADYSKLSSEEQSFIVDIILARKERSVQWTPSSRQ